MKTLIANSDVEICEGANPIIRECTIYGGQMSGIFVYEGGHGTIENCDIYGHANYQEVVIKEGSDPTLRTCKIHDGKVGGVLFLEHAAGTFENCDIYNNGFRECGSGQAATLRSETRRLIETMAWLFYRNRIRRESVLDCDLTGNSRGSWSELAGSQLSRSGNIE